jgi:phosphoribosylpyrophosphate synthetase
VTGMKRTTEKNLMVFSGRAHPDLATEVADLLECGLVPQDARAFANGELYVRYEESVRGCDAFVIQSHTAPINEWIMEHLIMVDALKRASAKRITVVMPFYGYARQDKKHRGREPISARLVADLFKTAGADRLITVDLHADQIQGFFDGPVDHLMALPTSPTTSSRSTATSSSPSSRPMPAGSRSRSAGPRASAAHPSPSSTRPAAPTSPTRSSPTASSVRSRARSAS